MSNTEVCPSPGGAWLTVGVAAHAAVQMVYQLEGLAAAHGHS